VPTAGLADVRVGDPQPLVLGGGLGHLPQQFAISLLDLASLAKRDASATDAVGEGVPYALELVETGEPRAARRRGNPNVDFHSRKGLDRELGELALEAANLAAQLDPSEALVAPESKRNRLSFEQFRHRSRV
jgi:hypothetical protein